MARNKVQYQKGLRVEMDDAYLGGERSGGKRGRGAAGKTPMADLVDLITARQEVMEGKPKTAFVIARAIRRTVLSREVLTALADYPFPVFRAATVQRQSYSRTAAEGRSVFEGGGSKEAAAEISAITDELLRLPNGA